MWCSSNCVRSICNQHQFRLLSNRQTVSPYGKHDKQNYQWKWGCARITNIHPYNNTHTHSSHTAIYGHHLGQIIRINSTHGQINGHVFVVVVAVASSSAATAAIHCSVITNGSRKSIRNQELWFVIKSVRNQALLH